MANDLFLRACRGERVERTPIWILRQAGRYLPEYRALRERVDFLTLCHTPELAARATLQPIDRFDLDAAILFSDILVPAEPMGFRLAYTPAPVVDPPIRTREDVRRMRTPAPEESVPFVFDTLRLLRRELADRVPLIGFAAAPFTLAAYLVEGGASKGFERIRGLVHADPATAHELLDRVSQMTERYLAAQVRAGAQAIQLFDTWAGLLAPADYREFGLRYAARVLQSLAGAGVPRIYFALDAGHLLEEIRGCEADVVGLDWRVELACASRRLASRFVLQGNLDPAVLLARPETIERRAAELLDRAAGLPGHVFNLGHGVLPATPPEHVACLVRAVRSRSN